MTERLKVHKYKRKAGDMSYRHKDFPFRRLKTINPIVAYLALHYDKKDPMKRLSIEKMCRVLNISHTSVKYYIIHGAKTKPQKELCYELSAKLGINVTDLLRWRPDDYDFEKQQLETRPERFMNRK